MYVRPSSAFRKSGVLLIFLFIYFFFLFFFFPPDTPVLLTSGECQSNLCVI